MKLSGVTFDGILRTASLVHGRFITIATRSSPTTVNEILIVLASHNMAPHPIGIGAIFATTVATLAGTFVGEVFNDGLVHDDQFLQKTPSVSAR